MFLQVVMQFLVIVAILLTGLMVCQKHSIHLLRLFQGQALLLAFAGAWTAFALGGSIWFLGLALLDLILAISLKMFLNRLNSPNPGYFWNGTLTLRSSGIVHLLLLVALAIILYGGVFLLFGIRYVALAASLLYFSSGVLILLNHQSATGHIVGFLVMAHSLLVAADLLAPLLPDSIVVALIVHFGFVLFALWQWPRYTHLLAMLQEAEHNQDSSPSLHLDVINQ